MRKNENSNYTRQNTEELLEQTTELVGALVHRGRIALRDPVPGSEIVGGEDDDAGWEEDGLKDSAYFHRNGWCEHGLLKEPVVMTFSIYGEIDALRPLMRVLDSEACLAASERTGRHQNFRLLFVRRFDGEATIWQLETGATGPEAFHKIERFNELAVLYLAKGEDALWNMECEIHGDLHLMYRSPDATGAVH